MNDEIQRLKSALAKSEATLRIWQTMASAMLGPIIADCSAPLGEVLTQQEREWCNGQRVTLGIDTEDQHPRLTHLVGSDGLALCKTTHLWLYGGVFNCPRGLTNEVFDSDQTISCVECLTLLYRYCDSDKGAVPRPSGRG